MHANHLQKQAHMFQYTNIFSLPVTLSLKATHIYTLGVRSVTLTHLP